MKRWFAALLSCLVLAACGYHEGIVQKSDKSFIKFTGNIKNATAQIDDGQAFSIEQPATGEEPIWRNTVYQVPPGKHIVKVSRNGQVVVERIIILDNQTTREVEIP